MTHDALLEKALLIRLTEERLLELYQSGQVHGTLHTCIGQEMAAVTVCAALGPGDAVLSNHRGHGHYLAFTDDVEGLITEVRSGTGGSQHLCRDGFLSSGIQGGLAPVALGLSYARRMQRQNKIAVLFIGDGTLGEGAIYESLNLAAKWELPLLVVIEHNGISQTTPTEQALAGTLEARAEAFGLRWRHGNTWNWKDLTESAAQAVQEIRKGSGPQVLIIDTFRLRAHSKGDDTRPASEIEPFAKKDPVNLWLAMPETLQSMQMKARLLARLDQAVAQPQSQLSTLARPEIHAAEWMPAEKNPNVKIGPRINEAMHEILKSNPRALFIGQDVLSPYGGAFKISAGLSEKFPNQVRSTPVSESAIAGLATGLAWEGYSPLVEFMFGDFTALAFDQIVNHAAKMPTMFGTPRSLPVIFRTPMGGRRGYGPTHSQSLEKHFLGVPGLSVAAINHFVDPLKIYMRLMGAIQSPWLIIENKELYGEILYAGGNGFVVHESAELLPTVLVSPQNSSVALTLIGYGGMSLYLERAAQILFEKHDIICQILCPTQIYPFDVTRFRQFLSRAACVFVAEEGQGFAGFGSEVLAQLAADRNLRTLRVGRLFADPKVIPARLEAEALALPSTENIVQGCLALVSTIT